MPTSEQLTQVKTNVENMMDFINHVHPFFSDKVGEVYLSLNSDQDTDPGTKFICTLLDSVFWSIGAFEFSGATVLSSFLGTFFGAYVGSDAPPDLGKTFAGVLQRLDATISQALKDLAAIHENPLAYWDKTYTNPFNNKTSLVSSIGDEASLFPSKYDLLFQTITDSITFQFRQNLTKSLLSTLYYVYFSDYYSSWQYQTKEEFFQDASDYIAKYPAYFFRYRKTWNWRHGERANVIQYFNFSIVRHGGSIFSVPSDDLCKWLFQDDEFGHQTNADGVAKRKDVFFFWGLKVEYPEGEPFGLGQAEPSFNALTALSSDELNLAEAQAEGDGPKPLQGPPAKEA